MVDCDSGPQGRCGTEEKYGWMGVGRVGMETVERLVPRNLEMEAEACV